MSEVSAMRGHLEMMRQYDLAAADLRCLSEALVDSQIPARQPPAPMAFNAAVTELWPAHGDVGRAMSRPALDRSALASVEDRTCALLSAMGGLEALPRGPLQGAVLAAATPAAGERVAFVAPHEQPSSLGTSKDWMPDLTSLPIDSGPGLSDADLAPTTKRRDGPAFEDEPYAATDSSKARSPGYSTSCHGSSADDCAPQQLTARYASVAGNGAQRLPGAGSLTMGADLRPPRHQRHSATLPSKLRPSAPSEVTAFLRGAR